jgi:hypothetical protein
VPATKSWIVLRSGRVSMRMNEISPMMAPRAPAPPTVVPAPPTVVPAWPVDVPAPPAGVPSEKPATISRSAIHQKPATRLSSGRKHRIPRTCRAGVWPLAQTMRPQTR